MAKTHSFSRQMLHPASISSFAGPAVENVFKMCFDKFESLPKTGKPSDSEWTVLAGVISHNRRTGISQVVSLGSGTKCIGKTKLCSLGFILNDSHAEVMARRGLLRYMYYQLNKAITGQHGIFEWVAEKNKFQLKDEISLHFLSTQTPCGDACIMATNKSDEFLKERVVKKRKMDEVKGDDANIGSIIDFVYTGAKLLDNQCSDVMDQIEGAVRTKPGRGERTLSMSCSDKLAKWQIMGVQGALLDFVLTKPIYFDTLNFWGENSFDSLERAIWKRFDHKQFDNPKYRLHIPVIRLCNNSGFLHTQSDTKQPSPNSLVWCDIPKNMQPYEISVNGKRQGITTKKMQTPQAALKISKFFLFKEFVNVIKLKPNLLSNEEIVENKPYCECKFLAKDYQNAWSALKMYYFKQWSQKPDNLLTFSPAKVESK